jgi:uncharacterized protein YjbI with pentapeptide repeats
MKFTSTASGHRAFGLPLAVSLLLVFANVTAAEIFEWEYVDPANPAAGKKRGSMIAGSHDIDAGPGFFTSGNLRKAYLIGADLRGGDFEYTFFKDAAFDDADIRNTRMTGVTESYADYGFTAAQLYSTKSYKQKDLSGIWFDYNRLDGWDFSGQNLRNAWFYASSVSNANFTGADIRGAEVSSLSMAQLISTASYQTGDLSDVNFGTFANKPGLSLAGKNLTGAKIGGGAVGTADFTGATILRASLSHITPTQLYSTKSYQDKDLRETNWGGQQTGWNFASQDLSGARFYGADLTGTNFRDARLKDGYFRSARFASADLTDADIRGADFVDADLSLSQIYATASYQSGDLSGAKFSSPLNGGNFAGKNLSRVAFEQANLTGADLSGADVRGASFYNTGLTPSQLQSTASFQSGDMSGLAIVLSEISGWDFHGQKLAGGSFYLSNVSGANFSQADLSHVDFQAANITGANFAGATIRGANFMSAPLTVAQLQSTASYQAGDLAGTKFAAGEGAAVSYANMNLRGAHVGVGSSPGISFQGADLTNALIEGATTDTDFTGAEIGGAGFFNSTITAAQLYSTASYQSGKMAGISLASRGMEGWSFSGIDLHGADFHWTDLENARFDQANLAGADFTGSDTTGVDFSGARIEGAKFSQGSLSAAQLYSTASYQQKNLARTQIYETDLSGWNFAGQNMANMKFSNFGQPNFVGANLDGADTRHALGLQLAAASAINTIRQDGHIWGLDLQAGRELVVRDYDGYPAIARGPLAVHVEQQFVMDASGLLSLLFDADEWGSAISFDSQIDVSLGGRLGLRFSPEVNWTSQVGRTIKIFDWTGVSPVGAFVIESPHEWDLTRLYTTGEITLVPECSSSLLAMLVIGMANSVRFRMLALC